MKKFLQWLPLLFGMVFACWLAKVMAWAYGAPNEVPLGNVVPYWIVIWDWLFQSPYFWRMIVYIAGSFLFFFYGFHFASRVRFRWRFLTYPVVLLLFYGCFSVCINGVDRWRCEVFYEHESSPEDNPLGELLQSKVADMRDLIDWKLFDDPEQDAFLRESGKVGFDPQRYFPVLTHLSLEDGYALDYLYLRKKRTLCGCHHIMPELYARKSIVPSIELYEDGRTEFPADLEEGDFYAEDWISKVRSDGTAEGFMELAVLYIEGDLWQHYNTACMIIASKSELEALLNNSMDFRYGIGRDLNDLRQRATRLDVKPYVEVGADFVTVSVLTYAFRFERMVMRFSKHHPHKQISWESELVLDAAKEYDIRF